MSSPRMSAIGEGRKTGNISSPLFTLHIRTNSYSSSLPHSMSPSPKPSSASQARTSSTAQNASHLKMVTTSTTSHHSHQDAPSYFMSAETVSQGYGWMVPTVIEDDDLMFGGKSLSAWHEEDRQKVSYPEEERRGRQRMRQHQSYSPQSYSSQSYSSHQSKTKTSSGTEQKKH